jgi:tetratricopeptide (TPR) repeat protein
MPNLTQSAEPDATASGADPAAATGESAHAGAAHARLPASGRYELGAEIARGGMGVVYRAADLAFQREVAIKVLHDKYAPDSGAARNFADEARITGQLQHPAISPAHDLGTLPDGRPFLAMKLIKGETLEELLGHRGDPATERGRFLAAFEQVCQAVAYAHAHNVIHRDLKPANIMVGNFGEVQVMDWGLAKVLRSGGSGEASDPDETSSGTAVVSLRDSDGAFTQAGSVLGTPAFMPPEQAVGAIHKIDARSDVFGLGGILAVILTGRPPFSASSAETTRVKAATGDVAECFARLDASSADPELIALCKRCLAPRAEDRPPDAGEVARAVAALRSAADERARQAELDRVKAEGVRATAEARAEEEAKTRRLAEEKELEQRKRRRVQALLAAALVLLMLAGGGFGWYSDRKATAERERLSRNGEAVSALLDQCESALTRGDAIKAAAALESAGQRWAEGGADELSSRRERLAADLAVLRELDQADQFLWTPIAGKRPDTLEAPARYRSALASFSADPDAVEPAEAAARVSSSTVRERLVGALDRLLRSERSARVRAALRLADPDPYRDAVRDAVMAADDGKLKELTSRELAMEQPAGFVAVLGQNTAIALERRRQLLTLAVGKRPDNLGLLMTLGGTYPSNTSGGANERLRWYQAAVATAPHSPVAHNSLGIALYGKQDYDGAIACYKEAIRLDPKYANAHNSLGIAFYSKQNYDGAIACFKEAIRQNPKSADANHNLGSALYANQDYDGAIACYKDAIRLDSKPAIFHDNLGLALYAKQNYDGAIACYKEAIRLNPNFADAHNNLGAALYDKQDHAGAIVCYQEAIRLDPRFALAHNNLGRALQAKGDLNGAISSYREAIRIDPKQQDAVVNLPRAERMRDLLPRLPGLLAGKGEPRNPAEECEFARLCSQPFQQRFAMAARLYEKAFTADLKQATELALAYRYYAAASAARAASGDGKDAPADSTERAALRAKALGWLRAELVLRRQQASSSSRAERQTAVALLTHWLGDSDLLGVRPGPMRTGLTASEAADWDALWDDVKTTLAAARQPPTPPEPAPHPRAK